MAFRIKKLGEATYKTFTMRDLLALVGDTVNDEVRIAGEVFRISTAEEIESSGGGTGGGGGGDNAIPAPMPLPTVDWIRIPITVGTPGQETFNVQLPLDDLEGLFLVVNGAVYDAGSNFHVQESSLQWHGSFPLDVNDTVYLKYLSISSSEPEF
ncbi:MAG: hypothetical protein ACOYOO_05850 [Saprospiraceae bacterium]